MSSLNHGRYIERALLSIIRQQYQGRVQVIVADGGSTDGTVEVLKRYPQITWWSRPDNGVLDAIEQACLVATGEFLAFMPSDDYYLENAFSTIMPFLIQYPELAFACGSTVYLEDNCRTFSLSKQVNTRISNPCDYILGRIWMSLQSGIIRRSCFDAVGGFRIEYEMCSDIDLFYRMLHFYEGMVIPEYVAVYQQHQNQFSRLNAEVCMASLAKMVEEYQQQLDAHSPYRLNEAEKRDFALRCTLYSNHRGSGAEGKEKSHRMAAEILKESEKYSHEVVEFAKCFVPSIAGPPRRRIRGLARCTAKQILSALQLEDWVRYNLVKRGTIEQQIASSLNWWQPRRHDPPLSVKNI